MNSDRPVVFLSYAHHPEGHPDRFAKLAQQLRADGVSLCFDLFDQSPAAGWPEWTIQALERADVVLLGCSEVWRSRFAGRLDERGGRGVRWEGRLLVNLTYHAPERRRVLNVVIDGDEADRVVPTAFAGEPRYSYPSDYASLLSQLVAADGEETATAEHYDAQPLLESIARDLCVLSREADDPLAQAILKTYPNASTALEHATSSLLVVCLSGPVPRRVDSAKDRAVIDLREAPRDTPGAAAIAVDQVRAAIGRLRRDWWLGVGRDYVIGLSLCLSWPALSVRISGEVGFAPWPLVCAGLLAAGLFFIAGVAEALHGRDTPAARSQEPLSETWRHSLGLLRIALGSTGERATTRARNVVLLALGVGLLGAQVLGQPSIRDYGTHATQLMIAACLGVVSTGAVLRWSGLRAWLTVLASAAIAGVMPRAFDQSLLRDALVVALGWPDLGAPATWVFMAPSALPAVAYAGLASAFGVLWMTRIPPRPFLLRTCAAVLITAAMMASRLST